ncbi:VHS-domain-containing protein [Rhizopus microsporus ATCC 52813]|uniref:VHS-domain-containing protein n=1 Tax=Rhizopus microsporus ATCC 52813 TaxID=1340429 RepID=A0A2G4SXL5_RHIZD|nr:VHS-domain-containing protein [Rhizopus microsporus ATCC 52813]PHZ13511.1 VHS-domain-containing protein [Rhizopus microsporus ATCC 52813]
MSYSLQSLIERACSPSRFDPNLALNLEICETINKKQGSAPRTAAMTIVKLVNSPRVNQAMLALTLLDNCAKNCGYPFHLQIATKEFLNALVRRFPERPPTRYAPHPVQSAPENQWNHFDFVPQQLMAHPVLDRILYLIKEWKIALTELSKYKEDMTHIRDMYRLLKFKGYVFPELRDSSVAALAPADTLKTVEELEEENRVAQAAKLQELIRRGRPQDLVEANRLMKIMTGYDQKHQPNYKEMFVEEVHKIQNKARLLYEMLGNLRSGDRPDETMEELKGSCENAILKIENMLKTEQDKEKIEEMNQALLIVKNSILKYQDIKKGRYNTSYDISDKFDSKLVEEAKQQQQEQQGSISLIDLDDDLSSDSDRSIINQLNSLTIYSPDLSTQPTQEPVIPIADNKLVDMVNKNGLVIQLEPLSTVNTTYQFKAYYSNKSVAPMDKMTLLLAAPKSMQLKLGPVSSSSVPPTSDKSVTQVITIDNPNKESIRLRYKITYEQFGVEMEQSGTWHNTK